MEKLKLAIFHSIERLEGREASLLLKWLMKLMSKKQLTIFKMWNGWGAQSELIKQNLEKTQEVVVEVAMEVEVVEIVGEKLQFIQK